MNSAAVVANVGHVPSPGEGIAATPGQDYSPVPNPAMVTFTTGSSFLCVTLNISDDEIDEPEEVFTITAVGEGARISIPVLRSATIVIADDDGESA